MVIRKLAKIPDQFMASFKRLDVKEGPESIYLAIARTWLECEDVPFDSDISWLDLLEEKLQETHPYNPNLFFDVEGWEDYLGEIVGIAIEHSKELIEHFQRIIPYAPGMEEMDVEFNGMAGEVTWVWTDDKK